MRKALVGALILAALPILAGQALAAGDVELRPATATSASLLEIVVPDVASGRSQKRQISDLMVRLSVEDGSIDSALRLPNGVAVQRDSGLLRAHVYVVSGGRLSAPTEARCDRWIEDLTVCSVACDGGVFGLKRRMGAAGLSLTLVAGRLPRGVEEGAAPGFNLKACAAADARDELLAPAANRALAEIPMTTK